MDSVETKLENVDISDKKGKAGKKSKGKDSCCDVNIKLEVGLPFVYIKIYHKIIENKMM